MNDDLTEEFEDWKPFLRHLMENHQLQELACAQANAMEYLKRRCEGLEIEIAHLREVISRDRYRPRVRESED